MVPALDFVPDAVPSLQSLWARSWRWSGYRGRILGGEIPSALRPTHSPHPSNLSHSPLARAPPSSPRPSPKRHLRLQNCRNGSPLPVFDNKSTSSILIVLGHLVHGAIASRVLPEIWQDGGSGSEMGFRVGARFLLGFPSSSSSESSISGSCLGF
jgi:hypothetical protein